MYSFLFCLCVSSFLDRFNTQASARNGHCLNCWKRSRLCASVTTAATLVILNALELGGQDKIIPILEYFSLSGRVLFFFVLLFLHVRPNCNYWKFVARCVIEYKPSNQKYIRRFSDWEITQSAAPDDGQHYYCIYLYTVQYL